MLCRLPAWEAAHVDAYLPAFYFFSVGVDRWTWSWVYFLLSARFVSVRDVCFVEVVVVFDSVKVVVIVVLPASQSHLIMRRQKLHLFHLGLDLDHDHVLGHYENLGQVLLVLVREIWSVLWYYFLSSPLREAQLRPQRRSCSSRNCSCRNL
ncbi:hypothetical protein TMatcc_008131 [Talaromyces marneffei ATCC 18224]|uniref:uncharacterized protein n=1 Tax=Talaromyces marneffei TaxID=37727 RepID=UPI0012AA568E|nr:uncharacterized protein EYB26_005022 [Talaromyces marneffei]QGA17351.1 hypothetical protein EYB26_005022 [Talaromyces marneffei]